MSVSSSSLILRYIHSGSCGTCGFRECTIDNSIDKIRLTFKNQLLLTKYHIYFAASTVSGRYCVGVRASCNQHATVCSFSITVS